jgi:putative transposase
LGWIAVSLVVATASYFCVEALEDALRKGKPDIFNTDQGSQFTGKAFTGLLEKLGIKISMDSKGSYRDTLFVY